MFVVSVPVLRAQQAPANAVQHQTRCLKPGLPAAIRSFAVRPLHRKLHRLQTAATTHTYALAGASASSSLLQTLPEPRSGGALSSEQLEFWKAHGWLSLEGFTSPTECEAMIARADELVEEFDPKEISVFTTKEQTRKSDTYFLESGDKVRFFFEEKAFDERGNLVQPKSTSINKIGHALHEHEPVFRRWGTSERIEEVLDALGFRRPLPVQSMYIFKCAAADRGRSCSSPRLDVPLHGPDELRRPLARPRGRHRRERLPLGPAAGDGHGGAEAALQEEPGRGGGGGGDGAGHRLRAGAGHLRRLAAGGDGAPRGQARDAGAAARNDGAHEPREHVEQVAPRVRDARGGGGRAGVGEGQLARPRHPLPRPPAAPRPLTLPPKYILHCPSSLGGPQRLRLCWPMAAFSGIPVDVLPNPGPEPGSSEAPAGAVQLAIIIICD